LRDTDVGLKYPTNPSMGPSNTSHILVISFPDLNLMIPSARPFISNVSRVLEQIWSFSSLRKIHPENYFIFQGAKTGLMVGSFI
jgi:hypothetical protein